MALASLRTHTDAVVDKLEAAGLRVGSAEGKNASGDDLTASQSAGGYVVLYPIPGGAFSGTLGAPNDDAELVYQVTCVGITTEQAQWVADKAITALLGGITVGGRHIARVWVDDPSGVRRDDAGPPTLFYATPRFRFLSVPS